jgi:hypothetical protein
MSNSKILSESQENPQTNNKAENDRLGIDVIVIIATSRDD